MHNTPPQFQTFTAAPLAFIPGRQGGQLPLSAQNLPKISTRDISYWAEDWLLVAEQRKQTIRTREQKREIVSKLVWFLNHRSFDECGLPELRRFFLYLENGHLEAGGRWGNARLKTPMRPVSAATYYAYLKGFFAWLVKEEVLPSTPFARLESPDTDTDQIQPFTAEQVEALFYQARQSPQATRDMAILRLMVSTGVRASELCGLQRKNLNLDEGYARIFGKRQKYRIVPFGVRTKRALWRMLAEEPKGEHQFIFTNDNGSHAGEPLSRSGLLQIYTRLGARAGLQSVRCSPHTMRHTFAVLYLDGGGNALDLMRLLGHTTLKMTSRYVALTNTRLQKQRQLDPGDKLGN